MRATLVLGDFAETDASSGKVHVLGAGWSLTGPSPSPQAVVAFLKVPADRVGAPIPFTLRLIDKARQVIEVPGLGGLQRLEISGQVELQVPDGWDGSTDLSSSFAVNIGVIPLKPGGYYTWVVEVDDKELASADFFVRSA
jgi:hypothetical protein